MPESSITAQEHWFSELNKMTLGTNYMLCDRFEEAEAVFLRSLFDSSGNLINEPCKKGFHDIRIAFACQHCLLVLMVGISKGAPDVMEKCLSMVWFAEGIAATTSDQWIGQKLMRIVCLISASALQFCIGSYAKAGISLSKAVGLWAVVKYEAETFVGYEELTVKSIYKFVPAILEFVFASFPSCLVSVTKFAGYGNDRSKCVKLLLDCVREDNLLAPHAATIYLVETTYLRFFINDPPKPAELLAVEEILLWAKKEYPSSYLFTFWTGDYYSAMQHPNKSISLFASLFIKKEFLGLEVMRQEKLALNYILILDFKGAICHLEKGVKLLDEIGRLVGKPHALMLIVVLSSLLGITDGLESLLRSITKSFEERRDSWFSKDVWAFRKSTEYIEYLEETNFKVNTVNKGAWSSGVSENRNNSTNHPLPLLDLCETLHMHCSSIKKIPIDKRNEMLVLLMNLNVKAPIQQVVRHKILCAAFMHIDGFSQNDSHYNPNDIHTWIQTNYNRLLPTPYDKVSCMLYQTGLLLDSAVTRGLMFLQRKSIEKATGCIVDANHWCKLAMASMDRSTMLNAGYPGLITENQSLTEDSISSSSDKFTRGSSLSSVMPELSKGGENDLLVRMRYDRLYRKLKAETEIDAPSFNKKEDFITSHIPVSYSERFPLDKT